MQPCSSLADPNVHTGREVGAKWKLLRLIGVGGTAAVYEAVHRNGRRAAVKLLLASSPCGRATARQMATSESRVANITDHPGVVAVLDDDVTEDGTPYLVMELLKGGTLEELRVRAGGTLPLAQALPILESVLETLAAFHERGIVHRDIKPDNVFVLRTGRVKVLDFGLAAAADDPCDSSAWFGTPGFMAPEQARGDWAAVDARADVWAAAATFYHVLTGRLVHPGGTVDALVRAARRDEVSLEPVEPGLPIEILDIIQRGLAFDRHDRWPSAASMLAALRRVAHRGRFSVRRRTLPLVSNHGQAVPEVRLAG